MSFLFFKRPKSYFGSVPPKAGFTLVEMIVTVGIFAVITSVVFAGYRDFDGGIVLTNLAYEIAITIRQAQVYGLSVRDASGGPSPFNVRYGIHLPGLIPNAFILFADVNDDQTYTSLVTPPELIENLSITRGNIIDDFCGTIAPGVSECAKTGGITWLDIMFLRPDPDALFRSSTGAVYQSATVVVKSPRTNGTKTITVLSTGQISVQ